jgi:hypothetical protein
LHSSAEPLINDDFDVPSRADGNRAVDAWLAVLWLEQTTYSSDRGCFLHCLGFRSHIRTRRLRRRRDGFLTIVVFFTADALPVNSPICPLVTLRLETVILLLLPASLVEMKSERFLCAVAAAFLLRKETGIPLNAFTFLPTTLFTPYRGRILPDTGAFLGAGFFMVPPTLGSILVGVFRL